MKSKWWALLCFLIVSACDPEAGSDVFNPAGPLNESGPQLHLSFIPGSGTSVYISGDWYWFFQLVLESDSNEPIQLLRAEATTSFFT